MNTTVDLYPKELYQKLEFDKILSLLSGKCLSPLGKAEVEKIQILTDTNEIQKRLLQTNELKQLLFNEEQPFPIEYYFDLNEELKLIQIENAVLNEQQAFRVYKACVGIMALMHYFGKEGSEKREKYPNLAQLLKNVEVPNHLLNDFKNILTDEGRVRNDASPGLISIRKNMNACYQNIDRKFVALLAEFKNNGWLKDPYETIRNGRRVVAVAVENKRKIRGIVHDESGTGNTLFIEPDETLHMNNELVELQLAEKREIYRILQTLTAKIRPHAEQIKRHQRLMAHLDFIRAKAMLAWDINAHMPRISEDKSVELFAACHPLLLLRNKAQGKKTIPLNLHFSLAERILVVSGPNAGGKSVLLKTVGLLQLMFQAGLLVPVADNSIMSVFSNFFVDIGDEQSIENDLSTYSSHLRNMRYFTEFANNKTLLLIDEFGAGTDPMLGGAIAEAILEHLIRKFCYGIITTHYANLKVFASKSNGVFNGSMAFDFRTLSPLYRLEIGRPGSSYAFELAQKSQLNTAIINTAKTKVDTNYKEFDELLNSLRAEKQQAVEREQAAAEKEARYEALLTEYNALFNDLDKRKRKFC
ncbi:MAG: endonuclease MutS2 [Sphingobacteriales bacterium]|nr:endonuclease MutS2 [Sphingobacteriales bacterium]